MNSFLTFPVDGTWKMQPRSAVPARTYPIPVHGDASSGETSPDGSAGSNWRMAVALAASLAFHLGLAAVASVTVGHPLVKDSAPQLNARLVQAQAADRAARPERPASPSARAATPVAEPTSTLPSRRAQFLSDPDLQVLETVPVTIPGSLSLRLKISAQGRVDDVIVIRSDPAPQELVDGLIRAFRQAKLAPARQGDESIASSLEVTVRFEPGLLPLDPSQR